MIINIESEVIKKMFTFLISFDEALVAGMLNGGYEIITSIDDYFYGELLVMRELNKIEK